MQISKFSLTISENSRPGLQTTRWRQLLVSHPPPPRAVAAAEVAAVVVGGLRGGRLHPEVLLPEEGQVVVASGDPVVGRHVVVVGDGAHARRLGQLRPVTRLGEEGDALRDLKQRD